MDCVTIFPQGRNSAKVGAILEAMKTPEVFLHDRELDADHNGSVITILGSGFYPLAGGRDRAYPLRPEVPQRSAGRSDS